MSNQQTKNNRKRKLKKSPIFLIALLNFLIIILVLIYIIYLRFIPYKVITYDGYAISGKQLVSNLLNTSFDVDKTIDALEVKDQDGIYQNLNSYYVGEDKKKNINLNYPIYVNDTLALYNLSSDMVLYTQYFQKIQGYSGMTLTNGALYNSDTLQRADFHDYILMKNSDNIYINTKEMEIKTSMHKYTVNINSLMNFTDQFITFYTLKDGKFIYNNILDVDYKSKIKIKDLDKEYTYEEFLLGLEIIKKEEPKVEEEEEQKNEIKDEIQEEVKPEENIIQQENIIEENIVKDEVEEPIEENKPDAGEGSWQKPEVTSTPFDVRTYIASTDVTIKDPSRTIKKAITFTFYKDEEIAFRISTQSSGELKVTKLVPDTKYKIVGTYQYKNKTGAIIEVKFFEQEVKTSGINNIKPIDLGMKNGQIYPNKIEISELGIISDIKDEAIYGVSRAEIIINNNIYPITTQLLRNILKGNKEKYESDELKSNTKYKYEIKFYDTAENEMDLNNNKGSTNTSKAEPTASIKVSDDITSIELKIKLSNQDNVEIKNYRYELISETGEIVKKETIEPKTEKLVFNDLNADTLYTIKMYADYDIEDGNGLIENRVIANETFITTDVDKLGSLKLQLDYNAEDLTKNSIKFNTKINDIKTDNRLIKILKEVKIEIFEKKENKLIETVILSDIAGLISEQGIATTIEELQAGTEYNIVITSSAKQGSEIKDIKTTYTLTSFKTKNEDAVLYTQHQVITTNMIDLELQVLDKHNLSKDGKYILELREWSEESEKEGSLIRRDEIGANIDFREIRYQNLEEKKGYILKCYSKNYIDPSDENKTHQDYEIGREIYITEGLEGNIELTGLNRKNKDSKNLIDIESNNNWYSQCFDVLETSYNEENFEKISLRKYGKQYNKETNTLTLTPTQSYVYNFKEYIGQTVTVSFKANIGDNKKFYIQEGKESSNGNLINLNTLTIDNEGYYIYTCEIPRDGYLGFYLDGENQLQIEKLQIELGEERTEWTPYQFELEADIEIRFVDDKKITYEEDNSQYWIRIIKNSDQQNPITNEKYDENSESIKKYILDKTDINTNYNIQIYIKAFGKEYVLDEINFKYDAEDCNEIKTISSREEFLNIQPDGSYRLLKNIDLSNASTQSRYTFGNPDIAFNGNIDFNGKTITKDIYNKNAKRTTSYIFYKISQSATINNIVIDFEIDTSEKLYNISEEDGIYSLFLYNDGTIDNLMLNLKECSKLEKRYIGLVGYQNNGTINKFVINLNKTLYGTQYVSGVSLYSSGIIQNGYMYGKNMETVSYTTQNDYRKIGGFVYTLKSNGIIQNVYNLSSITFSHLESLTEKGYSYGANIAYTAESGSQIRNVYSTKEYTVKYKGRYYSKLLDIYDNEVDDGPNVIEGNGQANNSYYFTDTEYKNNTYNFRQDKTVLRDSKFQNNLLNTQGEFIIEDCVDRGLYPQLKWDNCMPSQPSNEIEVGSANSVVDILSAEIIEYDDIASNDKEFIQIPENIDLKDENVKIALLKIYNSSGLEITNINIGEEQIQDNERIVITYVQNEIMYQNKEDATVTKLYTILHSPTTCIENYAYNISSITCRDSFGNHSTVRYTDNRKVSIKATFVKYIASTTDWDNIDAEDANGVSGLIQNYKLTQDLDFTPELEANSEVSAHIVGTFTGKIDGQNHKLSNITVSDSLFDEVTNSIKDLNIDNFEITSGSTSKQIGLMGSLLGATIDDIHVIFKQDTNLWTSYSYKELDDADTHIGAICGYAEGGKITNCSVKNIAITDIKDNDGITNNHSIGGIVGYASNTSINNCFVKDIDISSGKDNILGIGGIVGAGQNTSVGYCYAQGNINTNQPSVGGIFGNLEGSSSIVESCWSLVNITSNMTTGSAYLGGIGGYHNTAGATKNNIYYGNTYVASSESKDSRRIVGNRTDTKDNNNYGYNNQIINGLKPTVNMGETGLIDISEIYNASTYQSSLGGQYYKYSVGDEKYLPKLKYSNSNELLPNQEDIIIAEGLNILKVDVSNASDEEKEDVGIDIVKEAAKVVIKIENTNNYIVTTAEIENMEIQGAIIQEDDGNSETVDILTFIALPNKFYDTYKLNLIKYKENEQAPENNFYCSVKINYAFYNIISNLDEWNAISEDYENYRLIADITVGENDDIKTNVKLGSLITQGEDINHTISGKVLNQPLIEKVTTNLKNINFTNFTINARGLILQNNATTNNCNFSNITINAEGQTKVGIIAECGTGNSMENINIDHISVQGYSYTGGLSGYVKTTGNYTNIKGIYVCITGANNYIGGLFGQINAKTLDNIEVYQYEEGGNKENIETSDYLIKGINYIGGCIGSASSSTKISNIKTKDSKIMGSASSWHTGGCIGYTTGRLSNATSENNVVEAGCYVGGVAGYVTGVAENITSKNNNIISKNTTNGRAGGCFGAATSSVKQLTSEGNIVQSIGPYTGGAVGYASSTADSITVLNNEVSGTQQVGGCIGRIQNKATNITSKNSKIKSTSSYMGGCIGYTSSTAQNLRSINNRVETTGGNYIGGCIGITYAWIKNAKTEYDNTYTDEIKIKGNLYVGGIVGRNTYNSNTNAIASAAINGAYVNNTKVQGTGYVGGSSGYQTRKRIWSGCK